MYRRERRLTFRPKSASNNFKDSDKATGAISEEEAEEVELKDIADDVL